MGTITVILVRSGTCSQARTRRQRSCWIATLNGMDDLRITGGAVYRWLRATWPFVVLTADADGIRVSFLAMGWASWTTSWSGLERVDTTAKTVFLHTRSGRGCRFMASSPEALAPLIVLLGEHGIPRTEVRTTYPRDRIM